MSRWPSFPNSSQRKDQKTKMSSKDKNISPFLEEDARDMEQWECDDDASQASGGSSVLSSMLSSLTGTRVKDFTASSVVRIDEERAFGVDRGRKDPLASTSPKVETEVESSPAAPGGLKPLFASLSFGKGDGSRAIKTAAPAPTSRRVYYIWGAVALIIIASIIAVSVTLSKGSGSNSTGTTETDTDATLNSREKALLEIFKTVSSEGLNDLDSPQYKAREFIFRGDLLNLTPSKSVSNDRIAQRYALAVFYFSTNGPNTWAENNWLQGEECENLYWTGISCNDKSEVRAISFGEYA
jgi:hypothetical protein